MRRAGYIITFLSVLGLSTGCRHKIYHFSNDPDYKGKYMLYAQNNKGIKKSNPDEIEALYKQKAQYKLIGFTPYLYIHYIGKAYFDTLKIQKKIAKTEQKYDKKIAQPGLKDKKYIKLEDKKEAKLKDLYTTLNDGNWLMASFGEYPSILDTNNLNKSREQIKVYLHTHGFFRSKVEYKIDTFRRRCRVQYLISEGPRYRIKQIEYDILDSNLLSIVQQHPSSKLKPQEFYEEKQFEIERDRLFKLIKNNGYYDFTKLYIQFKVDTSNSNHQVKLITQILNPEKGHHSVYHFRNVYYIPNAGNNSIASVDTFHAPVGIHFLNYSKKYNTKILSYKIFIRPNGLYKQDSVQRSQQLLGGMDMYRFVNLNMVKNKTNDSLDVYIYTSPHKKYQITQEYGINVIQGLVPGPYLSISFRDRNIFNNYEIFDITGRFSIDGQPAVLENNKALQTIEWSVTAGLTFPQLFFPTKIRFKSSKYNPRTRLSISYNSVDRPEYKRTGFRAQYSYLWNKDDRHYYNLTPIDINVINSDIKMQEFADYLEELRAQGNNLYISFLPSLVTNLNFSYTFTTQVLGVTKPDFFVRPYIEIGGIVPYLFATHVAKSTNNELFGLQYYQYVKLQIDVRHYRPLSKKAVFASRLYSGIALPYGESGIKQNGSYVLPYEKYFFSGGNNSIRAWRYRRLGPGTYIDESNPYGLEQPGEILIELNLEWRQKMYKFIEGAYFIDIGNVWTIAKQATRPGAEFKYFASLPDMAVGSGVGLRFNFSFLIVRFDLAWKVWDPSKSLDNRFVLLQKNYSAPLLNFSIGYPF